MYCAPIYGAVMHRAAISAVVAIVIALGGAARADEGALAVEVVVERDDRAPSDRACLPDGWSRELLEHALAIELAGYGARIVSALDASPPDAAPDESPLVVRLRAEPCERSEVFVVALEGVAAASRISLERVPESVRARALSIVVADAIRASRSPADTASIDRAPPAVDVIAVPRLGSRAAESLAALASPIAPPPPRTTLAIGLGVPFAIYAGPSALIGVALEARVSHRLAGALEIEIGAIGRWLASSLPTALGRIEPHALEARLAVVLGARVDAIWIGGGVAISGGAMIATGHPSPPALGRSETRAVLALAVPLRIALAISPAWCAVLDLAPEIGLYGTSLLSDRTAVLTRDLGLTTMLSISFVVPVD
jgi:hypothetical protein